MKCRTFAKVAHAYLADELAGAEVARIDAHVGECAECAEFMRMCRELSCRELVEFLSDYVDDQLEAERRAVFDRHLGMCSDCRNYVDSFRRVMNFSALALGTQGHLPEVRVPEGLVQAILNARLRYDEPS